MAELKRVRFKKGTEGVVGQEYIDRWPEDIAEVLSDAPASPDPDSSESTPVPTPVQASKVASPKEKK